MPNNTAPGFEYPDAGVNAQAEVQEAVERFRASSIRERARLPLLYWLLGSGTPEYKESKSDSLYQDRPKGFQKCGNCRFTYQHTKSGKYICSQISGNIELEAWCRRWSS